MEQEFLLYTEENKNERPPFKNCPVFNFKIPINETEDNHSQMIRQLIGKSGRYFKLLTKQCQLRFIWCEPSTQTIDIWGEEKNIPRCVKRLELKIYNILKKMYYEDNLKLKPETLQWMTEYTRNFKPF